MITAKEIHELEKTACLVRIDTTQIGPRSGNTPHLAPALSCTDIVTALYFHYMNIDPKNPKWDERDRFVISKGHAALSLYAALARRGYFPIDELWKAKQIGAMLQGHPDMKKIPGIDATSGSLGSGLSFALGIAMARRYKKRTGRVYCLIGDGDAQEGMIWEAAMYAGTHKIDNLIAILDYNHLQSSGSVEEIVDMEPLGDCWKRMGWTVFEANGNNMADICNAIEMAKNSRGRPSLIVAHTTKGKGISFCEHNNDWHAKQLTGEQLEIALGELRAQYDRLIAEEG